jgi:outer membrane immunogenic protein
MRLSHRLAFALALSPMAAAAFAQDSMPAEETLWKGFYIGVNVGSALNSTCNSWTPGGSALDTAATTVFYNQDCRNNDTFVGGAQLGYNFQHQQIVFGFGLDYDASSAKTRNRSVSYAAAGDLPNGTYVISDRVSPDGFAIIGPRIGYAFGNWLPYFRVGSVLATGPRHSTATYTAPADSAPSVSFTGGESFKSSGYGVGAGVEYALSGPWSFRAEYTHVDLGKGTNSPATCSGTAAACAPFTGISLDESQNGFKSNIVRVGLNYRF